MLQGDDEALAAARARIAAGKPLGLAIDTRPTAIAEMLVALALDLGRDDRQGAADRP